MFDSGSHRSFVTTKVVERTGARVIRREWLGINTFGNQSKQAGLRDVVGLNLEPVGGGELIQMEAYVVPEISFITNEHLKIVMRDYPHLSDLSGLWLSDMCIRQDDLQIEVLIGSEYLWRFQGGCTIRNVAGLGFVWTSEG